MQEQNETQQKEQVYCIHTCRNCGSSFNEVDEIDVKYVAPFYKVCRKCLTGKNKLIDNKLLSEYAKIEGIYDYVYNNLEEELIPYHKFILNNAIKAYKDETGRVRQSSTYVKEAIEVLSYYLEDNDYSFMDVELEYI